MELHDAVWRNDLSGLDVFPTVDDGSVPDSESHWTPLHVALYYGHLRAALKLLKRGARLNALDRKNRTPLDLITKELPKDVSHKTSLFSWGNGMNYQLGTGNIGCPHLPQRLEQFSSENIQSIAVSKFHGLAVDRLGAVYSWGWGMGGRLGHPEMHLHSEGGAQLFPKRIDGMKGILVIAVAAAKHHSLAVASNGDVYSWGCNKDGRLGYSTGGNKSVTPRRLMELKGVKIVQAAAANAHSVVVSESGVVYTWGSNTQGQLGYGTSDSCCNVTPRSVEGLQRKTIVRVSASKHHTMALSEGGDVYSWGHKCVAPKKISMTGSRRRESTRGDGSVVQFHRGNEKVKRPRAVMIAAGVQRSSCLTTSGIVLCWKSDDPTSIEEVGGKLSGKTATWLAAGKYQTAAVTSDGHVAVFDAQHEPKIVPGMENAMHVAVGEQHFLALQRWNTAIPESKDDASSMSVSIASSEKTTSVATELELDPSGFEALVPKKTKPKSKKESKESMGLPLSLQSICEKSVVEHFLEPRSAVHLLRYADVSCSQYLRRCCIQFVIRNLSLVISESFELLTTLTDDVLLEIEEGYQRQILGIENASGPDGEGIRSRRPTVRDRSGSKNGMPSHGVAASMSVSTDNRFLEKQASVQKLKTHVERKLKEIRLLEKKASYGYRLDAAQSSKRAKGEIYRKALDAIDKGTPYAQVQSILSTPAPSHLQEDNQSPQTKAKKEATNKPPIGEKRSPSIPTHRNRDVGRLPTFLEPTFKQTKPLGGCRLSSRSDPTPIESMTGEAKPKKWTTLELDTASKFRPFGFKAVPSKEIKKMSLNDFMVTPKEPKQSDPKDIDSKKTFHKERGPAWGGKHPSGDVMSFRSIQEEQRHHRPGMRPPGNGVAVMERRTVGHWQTHCNVQIQSVEHIQIEEKAIQELSALYKDAEIKIRPGTARPSKSTQ